MVRGGGLPFLRLVNSGEAEAMVVNIGDFTVIGRIATLVTHTEAEETTLTKEIDHFIHIVSGIAIVLGICFFTAGMVSILVTCLYVRAPRSDYP